MEQKLIQPYWLSEEFNKMTQIEYIELALQGGLRQCFDPKMHYDSANPIVPHEDCEVCPLIQKYAQWVFNIRR